MQQGAACMVPFESTPPAPPPPPLALLPPLWAASEYRHPRVDAWRPRLFLAFLSTHPQTVTVHVPACSDHDSTLVLDCFMSKRAAEFSAYYAIYGHMVT